MNRIFSLKEHTEHILHDLKPKWEMIHFPEIDSTNTYAKKYIDELKPPCLIMADHQTHGKGRGGNTWADQGHGHQFLGTWVLALDAKQPDPRWTIALGYLIYASLQGTWTKLEFSMKAPNDLFLDGKKVGGILVESTNFNGKTYLFLGLGLNVFARPSDLKQTATALVESTESVSIKEWQTFVRSLATELGHFEKFVKNPQWLAQIEQPLMIALNKNTFYKKNPVRKITPEGGIQLDQGYQNWLEL